MATSFVAWAALPGAHNHKANRPIFAQRQGYAVLTDPFFNKGLTFTDEVRELLGLRGLLPSGSVALEAQIQSAIEQIRERQTPLDKYLFVESIRDSDTRLFYALLVTHTDELLPIVYTPTVGEACLKLSKIYRPKPRGLYISYSDKGRVKEILQSWPFKDIKVIVFTDGERILGLGDLGANGMGIPLGKTALYTALGGIPPEQCLGVTLDVGTNTEHLLKDPAYIGLRHPRVRGAEYNAFITEFMEAAQEVYGPNVLLQFEDFGNVNCFWLLEKWASKACSFNDDIQGTAATVLAALQASKRLTNRPLKDETFVFLGAGSAAIGIADLLSYAITRETGMSMKEARKRIWLVDSKGLVVASRVKDMPEQKHRYAHQHAGEVTTFLDAVKALKPTAIIGVSTIHKAFNKEVLEYMAEINEQPIIFSLSNPTSKAECTFEEAVQATNGRCIFASGSPFAPIKYNGKLVIPGQANNAYIFPGLGLGVAVSGIERVTTEDIYIAAAALGANVPDARLQSGCLFPSFSTVRDASAAIAAAIAENAQAKGRLTQPVQEDWYAYAHSIMYKPIPPQM